MLNTQYSNHVTTQIAPPKIEITIITLGNPQVNTMAVSSYYNLLARWNMDEALMELTVEDEHLRELGTNLESYEMLGSYLEIPDPVVKGTISQGNVEMQGVRLLKCWKQRCGSAATYEAMVKALLQIKRTDLAEKVTAMTRTFMNTSQSPPSSPCEINLATPTSPASSSGLEDMPSPAASNPSSLVMSPIVQTQQDVIPTLEELEEEFYQLVQFIKSTLMTYEVHVDTLTSRFEMLPQSIRRRHETDKLYTATRQKILDSTTTKELFNNLTALKHWNYKMPETLTYILRDVKVDDIHQMLDKYKHKLANFKANTMLRELIGISFPVPDYCMELTTEVEGWEDKTIQEVENSAVNIVRQAVYNGSPHVSLGWKGVCPGSIKLKFILTKSVKLIPEKLLEEGGVVSVQIDGDSYHRTEYIKVNHKSNHYFLD